MGEWLIEVMRVCSVRMDAEFRGKSFRPLARCSVG